MSVEVGQKVTGKVTGITHFGAFVELPENQSGLVHISEVSDGFVKDINSVLSVGQEVEVKVLTIANDGKISLSIRQANENKTVGRPQRQGFRKGSDNQSSEPKFKKNFDGASNENRNFPNKFGNQNTNHQNNRQTSDFDQLMSNFLKDSEERLTSIKRNTEGKRGGRGGRRS
ncbi:RNA-binding protein S1 [Globicatella sp. HMSC072A10]|uniref:S1 domain-containing RNA-binding protein n=1 Tax=Globicatella sp. HMSC072A10 TaxID=1739315 RepID=UPI0008C6EB69|nr:S1 domain-containing RNA-binding protein [Globicatella sp. HMSC072A10]OFK53352.1 RNA-binding protein S1 [Globicatella sp. HMSC072A10]